MFQLHTNCTQKRYHFDNEGEMMIKILFLLLLLFIQISFASDYEKVVRDSKESLVWEDTVEISEKINIWKMAKAHCKSLSYAGYSDWRLPSKSELQSLAQSNGLKKEFIHLGNYIYWSGDDDVEDDLNAYVVYVPNAFTSISDKCEKNYAICVHDIK